MVESGPEVTRSCTVEGDSALDKTKDASQSNRSRDDEEPSAGHSRDQTDDDEMAEPERRVTRGLLVKGGPADGKAGRVKVMVSKRQQDARKKREKLLKLYAMQAEAPSTRGKDEIMAEIWRSREPKPLEDDKLLTKNDVLQLEDYLVCTSQINPKASIDSRAKVLAKEVIGVWTKCKVTSQPFDKVKNKCKYLLKSKINRVKHKRNKKQMDKQMGAPLMPNGEELLDICECRCFEDLDAKAIHPESCACETEEGTRKDPWRVTEGSLDFYVDQRTTRRRTAVLD